VERFLADNIKVAVLYITGVYGFCCPRALSFPPPPPPTLLENKLSLLKHNANIYRTHVGNFLPFFLPSHHFTYIIPFTSTHFPPFLYLSPNWPWSGVLVNTRVEISTLNVHMHKIFHLLFFIKRTHPDPPIRTLNLFHI
jgi:hypothetical protein